MIPSQESESLPLPAHLPVQIFQFHVLLLTISPAIWRRFLIRSDITITDLHHVLQIVMGWSDEHLHRYRQLKLFKSGNLMGEVNQGFSNKI